MRRCLLLTILALACTAITGDFTRIVAIEVVGTLTPTVEEGDTLRLHARAIDAAGDSVPEAVIVWSVLDTGQVGLSLDSLSGLVTALSPGSWRVQARVENLTSGVVTVTVTARPDTIMRVSSDTALVPLGGVASEPLTVSVADLTTTPGQQLALGGKSVHFVVIRPSPDSGAAQGIFLTVSDTVPGADPYRLATVTDAGGQASAVIRRVSGATPPDTVVVHAVALTATQDTVPGSPVPFVIVFVLN